MADAPYIPMYKSGHMLENGKYRLERMLGHGTYAEVWLATDTADGSSVAIKIKKWQLTAAITIGRFEDEKSAAMKLGKCPYIVAARGFLRWTEDGREMLAIVYEYIDGGETLRDRVFTHQSSEYEALRVTCDILRGLALAHTKGVIHRDLKPENVLMSPETDPPTAMIGDFGVAAVSNHGSDRRTRAQTQFGTPQFTAPEQWFDVRLATPRSDLFSLGVMVAELMGVDSLAADGEVNTWLDEERRQAWLAHIENEKIREFVEKATRNEFVGGKVIEQRFASASVMLATAETIMVGMSKDNPPWLPRESLTATSLPQGAAAAPDEAPAMSPFLTLIKYDRSAMAEDEPVPEPRPRRWSGIVIGAIALLVIGGGAAMFWQKEQPDVPKPMVTVATVETPIETAPTAEPKPNPPIVTPTLKVEVAPEVKVEEKPKVEPKPIVKPVVKPKSEEPKLETAKVATVSATITSNPATAKVGDRIEIAAKVAIPDGATVKSVKLYYKGDIGAYQNLSATFDGTTAKVTIPITVGLGTKVVYYIDIRLEGDNSSHKSVMATTTIVQ